MSEDSQDILSAEKLSAQIFDTRNRLTTQGIAQTLVDLSILTLLVDKGVIKISEVIPRIDRLNRKLSGRNADDDIDPVFDLALGDIKRVLESMEKKPLERMEKKPSKSWSGRPNLTVVGG